VRKVILFYNTIWDRPLDYQSRSFRQILPGKVWWGTLCRPLPHSEPSKKAVVGPTLTTSLSIPVARRISWGQPHDRFGSEADIG